MRSKGWDFRKAGAPFTYFLFLVSYSLFTLRFMFVAKKILRVWEV
jgi:hypothetical protein